MPLHARAGGRTLGLLVALALVLLAVPLDAAVSDTAPPSAATKPTVSADALPTVQVNGVVWAQAIVGNRVYVTGKFSQARPAGAAPGTRQTARANILAYDLTTGALISSWAPRLNAQGLAIVASPDGKRIYVAGDFTRVSGLKRYRIAAINATTGSVSGTFKPAMNARVRALAVNAGTVYAGGIFTTASGKARTRLAAFAASTGGVRAWRPKANAEVMALTVPPGSGKVIAGGRFTKLSGVAAYGQGALSASTGKVLAWAATKVVRDAGKQSAIYSLSSDSSQVYGTGYRYGTGGNLEGSFAARVSTGSIRWVNGCRGDTYSSVPISGVLYTVGHAHDCSMIGAFPQTKPWSYQRALATTTAPDASGAVNTSGPFKGRPAPELLHWLPTLTAGSYTGQTQAAWTVSGTSRYVVLGGEFPKVNGVAQQGLVRLAVRDVAPNTEGPRGYATLQPTLAGTGPGTVRATWTAAWDRDNERLHYELLRGPRLSTAEVVGTRTVDASSWWNRPQLTLTDSSARPGETVSYRVRVTDPLGNSMTSLTSSVSVPD